MKSIREVEGKLSRLEEERGKGTITQKAYEKLKQEYEEELRELREKAKSYAYIACSLLKGKSL